MTTYSITLDDVDLALLPLRTRTHNNFLKKEHYHFQVMSDEPVEELVDNILYTCHICAIEVPAAFAREHASSVKHRACARIARVAARRMRALVSAPPPPCAHAPPTAGRFCANCATVVDGNHDKTKEHRVAVMHDKLLWELMSTYVGDDRDGDSKSGENSDDDVSDIEDFNGKEKKKADSKDEAWNYNINASRKNELNGLDTNKKIGIEVVEKQNYCKGYEAVDDGTKDCKDYEDIDSDTKNSKAVSETAKYASSNKICIEVVGKPKNDGKYYEEYNSKSKNNTPKSVETAKSASSSNKLGIKVLEKEKQNGKDYEDYDSDTTNSTAKSVNTAKYASISDKIGSEVVDKQKRDGKDYEDNDSASKYSNTKSIEAAKYASSSSISIPPNWSSEVSDKTESGANNNSGTISKVAKSTQDNIEYVDFVTPDNKLMKVFSDHYHSFVRREGMIECIVCRSTFDSQEANSHMFSVKHLHLMPSYIIDEHCVRKINDIYSHCLLCNQVVKTSNVGKHHLTYSHSEKKSKALIENAGKNSLATVRNPVNQAKAKQNSHNNVKAERKTEEIVISTTSVSATNSNGTKEKAKNVTPNVVKSANVDWPVIYPYEVTEQESVVRCLICDCKVPNSPDNRKGHLVGLNHAKNVKTRRIIYPYESTNQKKIVRCVVCDCHVPNKSENKNEHHTGSNHAKAVKSRNLSYPYGFNKKETVVDCLVCDYEVPNRVRNRAEHLLGSRHGKNLEKEEEEIV